MHYIESGAWDLLNGPYSTAQSPLETSSLGGTLVLVGGQTSHACGDVGLGVCQNDIWTARIAPDNSSASQYGLTLEWSYAGDASFSPRCGGAVFGDRRLLTSEQLKLIAVVGGQLSFVANSSADCASTAHRMPQSVNDAWYASANNLRSWRRGSDAPFAPRRSMQADDSYVTDDSLNTLTYNSSPLLHSFRYVLHMDKTVSLSGGIRYLERRWNATLATSRMTRAETWADVWTCTLPTPEYDLSPVDCDWRHSVPLASLDRPAAFPARSTGSLPVPVAYGADVGYPAGHRVWNARFGGVSSVAAMQQWRAQEMGSTGVPSSPSFSSSPSSPTFLPIMLQPLIIPASNTTGLPEPASLSDTRLHRPIRYVIEEEELASSSFQYGSDTVVTHTLPFKLARIQPLYSTAHEQGSNMALSAAESTVHLYQAASCFNTTRPLFDFSFRRRDHRQSFTWDNAIVSGGITSSSARGAGSAGRVELSNAWIRFESQSCLAPDDPSYRSLLGDGVLLSRKTVLGLSLWVGDKLRWVMAGNGGYYVDTNGQAQFLPGITVRVTCDSGFHFLPVQSEAEVELTCMSDGLWYDRSISATRRCVPYNSTVQCDWPFVRALVPLTPDYNGAAGDSVRQTCFDPQPNVDSLQVAVLAPIGLEQLTVPSPAVVDLESRPLLATYRDRQLWVRGQWFTPPVQINIAGRLCMDAQLVNSTRYCTARHANNRSDGAGNGECRLFSTAISCTLPFGRLQSSLDSAMVIVRVGSHPMRTVYTSSGGLRENFWGPSDISGNMYTTERAPLLISTREPRVAFLGSELCKLPPVPAEVVQSARDNVRLVDCPNDRSFSVLVCVDSYSFDGYQQSAPAVRFVPTSSTTAAGSDNWECNWNIRTAGPDAGEDCDARQTLPRLRCNAEKLCGECIVSPQLGSEHKVIIALANSWSKSSSKAVFSGANMAQVMSLNESASLSFASCAAGHYERPFSVSSPPAADGPLCVPCPAGTSTNGFSDQRSCSPCTPGYYSGAPGAASCEPCAIGFHSPTFASTACLTCPLNSYQRYGGQAHCTDCDANQYLRPVASLLPGAAAAASPPDVFTCETCPVEGVDCTQVILSTPDNSASSNSSGSAVSNGTTSGGVNSSAVALVARQASYLLIDPTSGLVSSLACSSLSCSSGSECLGAQPESSAVSVNRPIQRIPATGVPVINCCGPRRLPAVDDSGALNVLCAECASGYAEIHGNCVECTGTEWGLLSLVLLMALLLVYLLHRFSARTASSSSSAVLAILIYFVQMSALFLAGDSMPVIMSLLNMDLLGDGMRAAGGSDGTMEGWAPLSWCIIPLSSYGKIVLRLLSPLIAVALLALMFCVQLGIRSFNKRAANAQQSRDNEVRRATQLHHTLNTAPSLTAPLVADTEEQRLEEEESMQYRSNVPVVRSPASHPLIAWHSLSSPRPAPPPPTSAVLLGYRATLLRLCLFSYNSLTTTCLSFFHWQQIGILGRRLLAYPAVDVSDATYQLLKPVIAVCLFLVAVVGPVALAFYLRSIRAWRMHPQQQQGRIELTESRESSRSEDNSVNATTAGGSLLIPYKESYWFFSVYVLVRRLLLVSVVSFAPPSSVCFLLSAVNTLFLSLQLQHQPYKQPQHNRLESLTLAALVVQTWLLAAQPFSSQRTALVTVCLWLSAPTLCVAIVMHQIISRVAHRCTPSAAIRSDDIAMTGRVLGDKEADQDGQLSGLQTAARVAGETGSRMRGGQKEQQEDEKSSVAGRNMALPTQSRLERQQVDPLPH